MLILGLDTATATASVALIRGKGLLAEEILNIPQKTHSKKLLPVLARLLTGAGVQIEDVDAFAVSAGPGSLPGCALAWVRERALPMPCPNPSSPFPPWMPWPIVLFSRGHHLPPFGCQTGASLYCPLPRGLGPRRETDYLACPARVVEYLSPGEEPVILLGDGIGLLGKAVWAQLGERAFVVPAASCLPRASSVAFWARGPWGKIPRGIPL